MVTKIVMPRLSLTMKEGSVGKWYKKEGDRVEKGEPIVEVVSEKATYDVEAPSSGILRKVFATEGTDVPVNELLAVITAENEPFSEAELRQEQPKTVEEGERQALASPAAKRLARERGLNLSLVEGSGPDGRISEEDIKRFLEEQTGRLPKVKQVISLSGLRKTSAERVAASFRTAPHSTLMMDVDVSRIVDVHNKLGVSYTAILAMATSRALSEHPMVNSTLEGSQIKVFENVNVGLAMNTPNGLVVPVLHDADKKSLQILDTAMKELTEKARQGKLTNEDLSGGTFTITNLGMYGVDSFTPIINPPEAAILGVGRIVEKPAAINDRIEIKPMLTLSLSYDHRVLDGAPAADFLRKVKENLEKFSETNV
jgi:pyruvate dehydrogenase E2 component (dihydrolipoamide acetyltransferase)